MSAPTINQEHLNHLKVFIDLCKTNPSVLHQPDLAFVKSFIEHFGGKIPEPETDKSAQSSKNANKCNFEETELETEVNSEESDLELDMTAVIEPDTDAPQKMGNPTLQPTEDEIAESQAKRSEAVSAFVEKDYEKAVQLYTDAIILNPQAALLYAKRGQIYLLLNKPNACIRDCVRALELNPDSAAAHKFRGRAYHLLGQWEEAANDLRLACKFDFDEQADEWLRETTPNARKIEEHKRKKERKLQEKSERPKQEGLNDFPSVDFFESLKDPKILEYFQDPEILEAFQTMLKKPSSVINYLKNPKIAAFIEKLSKKYDFGAGGMGGFPGMMAGMSGFSGANPPPRFNPPKSPQPQDDVGLD